MKFTTNDNNGRFFVAAYRNENKPVATYYKSFLTAEHRKTWIEMCSKAWQSTIDRREAEKQAKKEYRANFVNPYEVGQIFSNSWGYDQTNVDWYQIVKTTKKGVVLRPITASFQATGFMSGQSTPEKDSFWGEKEIKKTIQFHCYQGEFSHYIPMKHGCMTLYTGGSEYSSSYA